MKTPEMKAGTVEMVDVLWIMQNAQHSVDRFNDDDEEGNRLGVDYHAMMVDKSYDCHFATILNAIDTYGFRCPIVMLEAYGNYGLTHGNGHHRMCASILLFLEEIPVYWSDCDYMEEEISESEELDDDEGDFSGFSFGYSLYESA